MRKERMRPETTNTTRTDGRRASDFGKELDEGLERANGRDWKPRRGRKVNRESETTERDDGKNDEGGEVDWRSEPSER